MRKIHLYLIAILFSCSFFNLSCGNQQESLKDAEENLPAINETEVLQNFLTLTGDFINDPRIPTMITAEYLYDELNNPELFIIDTRSKDLYEEGHIEGAVNVEQSELFNYFKFDFNAANYEEIVIVCKSGQSSSYMTSVLQLLGYKNVYALKRGMSAWNKVYAENIWIKNATGNFADKLESTPNSKASKSEFPKIETGKRAGIDILEARAKEALNLTAKDWGIRAEKVFENPSDYYIINYWPASKYNIEHIPTAIQYTPKESLSSTTQLNTVPTNKKIAVYCYTGQHAAFVVAYLRILGYDAYSILYGSNGFMNTKMKEGGAIGHAFTTAEVMNYPSIVGPNPTDKVKSETTVQGITQEVKVTAPKKKKKTVAASGGC